MKKLFKLFVLILAILSVLTVCPDYPTILTTSPLLITPATGGMSNFPSSTKQLSISAIITPKEAMSGSDFYLFSVVVEGSSNSEFHMIYVQQMDVLATKTGGSWIGNGNIGSLFPSGLTPISLFLSFDMDAKKLKLEAQTDNYKVVISQNMINTPTGLFDGNSKFYFCADSTGGSTRACEISNVVFEYRYYGDSVNTYTYGHLGGTQPSIAAFYPLVAGSLATSVGSAASAYFGDKESNPTSGTTPAWDPSNNFVTIAAGQFITFPLPSIASTIPTISSSFSFSAWVKITSIPTAATITIFSMYSATGTQVGFNLVVTTPSNELSLNFGSQALTTATAAATVTLNEWKLIGFTTYLTTDKKSTTGNIFSGTSTSSFELKNQASAMDLSAASVIRIGDSSNSFSGQISLVRILTPGGGIVRTTDLCSSDSSMELGVGSFSLACSGSGALNTVDSTCTASCATGTYKATDTATPICVSCPEGCSECDNIKCTSCESSYLLYNGDCVSSCPDKTYSDGSACQSCSDTNCQKCDNTKCLTCDSSYLLSQGECVSSCPDKTYSDGSACQSCSDTNCKKCNNEKCLTCDSSFLLYQDACVNSCPDKTYSDGSACQSCSDSNCKRCSTSKCLTCDSSYLLYQGACIDSCPDQTYSDGSSCQSCSDTNCKECNSNRCLLCNTNYLLYKAGCVNSCPSKTYSDGSICQSCSDANCKQCDDSKCLTCDSNFLLYQDGCISSCPDQTYSDGSSCQSCSDSNCQICESSKCMTCESNYLVYQGDCLSSCPSKTYSTSSACYDCTANCEACESSGCLACETNYLFYKEGCVDACPNKSYQDGASCIACANNCAECDSEGCKVCEDEYQFSSNKKCIAKISTEEAGGISGGTIAGIVCGCFVIVSFAGFLASRFVTKKFPFHPKKTTNKIYPKSRHVSNPEIANLVSPSQCEINTLVP